MKTPHHCSFFRRKTNLDTSAVNVATPCRYRTQEENKKKQLDSCDAHIHLPLLRCILQLISFQTISDGNLFFFLYAFASCKPRESYNMHREI